MRPDISNWRVLAVDDEPDNLLVLADVVEIHGATVHRAYSGQAALDAVDQFEPTVILLDLRMPGVDGWEVHERLRAQTQYDHIPIIAITALAMPADIERANEAGFDGYVVKPLDITTLIPTLLLLVQKFNQTHAAAILETAGRKDGQSG
jgi:CheY-like chemotaxis protein